jgi:methylated-DNA-[protein]-cysteine S-methyltransferase
MSNIIVCSYSSFCGELRLGAFDGRLCLCDWVTGDHNRDEVRRRLEKRLAARFVELPPDSDRTPEVLRTATRQLDEYFAGTRREFTIPLLFAGTDFQRSVWEFLLRIPYGTTLSYSEMASRMGVSFAVRAVAGANRVNAISIIVPCHRVIGSNGTLTGYAGGLNAKKILLDMEQEFFRNFAT